MTPAELFESPALDLLLTLERDGLQIEVTDADIIRISPADHLDEERLAQAREYKPQLVTLIRLCDDGVTERAAVFRSELAATPPPRIPPFLFRPAIPYQPGVCFSCGDQLPTPTYGRCLRCSLAFRLAAGVELPSQVAHARDEARLVS